MRKIYKSRKIKSNCHTDLTVFFFNLHNLYMQVHGKFDSYRTVVIINFMKPLKIQDQRALSEATTPNLSDVLHQIDSLIT